MMDKKIFIGGKEKKGNFACCFCSFLHIFERGFLQKISKHTFYSIACQTHKSFSVDSPVSL